MLVLQLRQTSLSGRKNTDFFKGFYFLLCTQRAGLQLELMDMSSFDLLMEKRCSSLLFFNHLQSIILV